VTTTTPTSETGQLELGTGTQRSLYLIDGMALVYRGYFAMIQRPPTTATGINTAAPFVFTSTLLEILDKYRPTHMAVVFDTPTPTHRHEAFPEYKAQRESMPDDLSASLPYIQRLCESFRIPTIRVDGWEADDVIGTIARMADDEGQVTTYMVTPDKDFAQLVSDQTFLYRPGRKGSDAEVLGVAQILEEWQIERIEQVIDILALMGDSVDNVPGVPGVGKKTAQKLISEYDTVENLLDHVDELKGKRRQVLEEHEDQAMLSKRLVTIDRHVPLDCTLESLARQPFDDEALKALFAELEFNMFGKRLYGNQFEAAPRRAGDVPEAADRSPDLLDQIPDLKTLKDVPHQYEVVEGPAQRAQLIGRLTEVSSLSLDLETTSLNPKSSEIIGLAISLEPHTGAYVPLPEDRQAALEVLEEFRLPLFENPEIEKIGHNIKFDLATLLWHGIALEGQLVDTMIAAHLAVPDMRRSLDYLAQALLGYRPIPIAELIGEKGSEQKSIREVPLERLSEYAVEDADLTLQLSKVLREKLKETGQVRVFEEVEAPLIPVLAAMEFAGIRVDPDCLRQLSNALEKQIEAAAKRIEELAGEPFNLNSPSQLGTILFDKLKLDAKARRTKKSKQYQTNELVLTRLAHKHEIARQILDYRTCTKLKSTYLDMLPGTIFPATGRIHTHYEQAVAATGRMQSSDPNLQNIPVRTERGREIRKAFVPGGDEYTLLCADYSQIELRVIAEICKDERMIRAFQEGEDIHTVTASRVYGVPPEVVTSEMRRQSKTVNFGIVYGISAFGLAERLGIMRGEAAQMIEHYFEEYPGVRRYMDERIDYAREHGYVETMTGRRRYLRDINSKSAAARQAAERNAINSPIQGSAADMIKLAMQRIHAEQSTRGWRTRMLLQVHDELVFDLYREEEDEVKEVVAEAMMTALPMSVPIVVEMGTGDNWLDAH
jgi:DNA polymerase-1